MRAILAGLFVYGTTVVIGVMLANALDKEAPLAVVASISAIVFLLLLFVSFFLFNLGDNWSAGTLESLEGKGLVISTEYAAKRAFQIEEFEDEGLHYYLELEDGSLLYLTGQYLYDYEVPEEDRDDSSLDPCTVFPGTRFTLRRHKNDGYVLELTPAGTPLWPEEHFPFPSLKQLDIRDLLYGDGDIITDVTFDEMKRRWRVASGA